MISNIIVKNIALIEKTELKLNDGLNILTGETGAGKSIIIDAINFVIGERADKTLIRYGSNDATVEAVFEDYLTDQIKYYLEEIGIEPEEILVIKRKMTIDNKNECRINNSIVTLSTLRGLTSLLVDIYGQHQHQSLLDQKNHVKFIDEFGKNNLDKIKNEYNTVLNEYKKILIELDQYGNIEERNLKISGLKSIVEEIEELDLKENEYEALLEQREKQSNVTEIADALSSAKEYLDSSQYSITQNIKQACRNISSISSYAESLNEIYSRLESAQIELDDIVNAIDGEINSLDFNQDAFDKLETRIKDITYIFRKYVSGYNNLKEYFEKSKKELDMLENADFNIGILTKKIKDTITKVLSLSQNVYLERIKISKIFASALLKELADLGLGSSKFEVSITHGETIDKCKTNGSDGIEFLISTNAGQPLKPLSKVASGGEMSRIMLGIKNIGGQHDNIKTMIFDEIDTGISGAISQKVAEKMCNISRTRQVIAITHLPQLASMADYHYLIKKYEKENRTFTEVNLLDDRTEELARIVGSEANIETAMKHSAELIKSANEYKRKLMNK